MTPIPIVALDYPTADDAMRMVRTLGARCAFYKIGSELFTAAGPVILGRVRDTGADVFLDLKLHDIPNTVRGAARAAVSLGVRLLTVHGVGGEAMLRAAVEAGGDSLGILGVTVLTSFDEQALADATGRPGVSPHEEVMRLAAIASQAGAHGVVCAGTEATAVRDRFAGRLATLVPGIRLAGGAAHDQRRVVTAGEAARAGARYIVLGRAVTAAADPSAAMAAVLDELDELESVGAA